MAEESLIKRKLLLDGHGMGDNKRLQMFIKQLAKWIYSDESPDEVEASYNRLVAQLHSFELTRKKSVLSSQCHIKQKMHYNMIQASFEERTELIRKDIEKQQNLLKRAKVFRKNNVEYDLLVRAVNQEPCRNELKEKIDRLREEVAGLEKERLNLDIKLNFKVKQCHVLSTSANAIKNSLKEENCDWDSLSIKSEASECNL